MNNDLNNNQGGMILGNVNETQNDSNVESLASVPNEQSSVSSESSSVIENLGESQVMSTDNSTLEQNTNSGLVMDSPLPQNEPAPQVLEPEPSYTNPQTINPSPMTPQTGFQPQNTIGITPPVSLEPEKKKKKPMNKTLFVALVLVALLGVGFGTYYILNYTDLLKKKEDIVIETKNLELSLGAVLPEAITEYAKVTGTNVSNCNPVDASEVNINAPGVYKYTITCGKISKIGTITIVDNAKLVAQTKTVYKTKGQTLNAYEFAAVQNDGLKYEFESQSDVDVALASEKGTYPIKLKVSKDTKTSEVTANLVILEYPIKGYVTCEANAQTVSGLNATKVVAEKFGILDSEKKNSYAGFGYEISTFTFTDATVYSQYEKEFKEKGSVTLDGTTGVTEFSTNANGESIIIITTELDNNKVLSDYGEDNMKDYGSITNFFGKTANGLGYNCSYKKAE